MSKGWISIHRKIKSHWIYKNKDFFHAWIVILLTVNHSEKKVLIGSKLFDCNKGQSLLSLESWASEFGAGWNKTKTRRFFNLLKKDKMIDTESVTKTTRLTVLNYSEYQDSRNASETQVKRKRNASETQVTPNNNVNNKNNVNNDDEVIKKSKPKKETYSESFETAWNKYDRKGSKKKAYLEWKKKSDEDKQKALNKIEPYFEEVKERKFRKDFERYLRDEKYEDSFKSVEMTDFNRVNENDDYDFNNFMGK